MMFLSYILIALSAICSAIADRVETTISFKVSSFRNKKVAFWCKPISAHNVGFIPFTKYRPDAWHLAKSGMIICFVSSAAFYHPFVENFLQPFIDNYVIAGKILFIILGGTIYIQVFNLFYNKILKA